MATRKMPNTQILWTVVGLSLVLQTFIYFISGFGLDDSWITFRYAENLVAGHGLVYNIGERVQGSTAPLEIFLVAGLFALGIPSKIGALLISLAATIVFLLCAYRLIVCLSDAKTSPFFLLPLAVAPLIAVISVSGMETMLFILLLISVFLTYAERRPLLLGLFAGLLVMTRIDGILAIIAITVTDLFLRIQWVQSAHSPSALTRRFADPWPIADAMRGAAVFTVLLAPWIVFTTWYFGNFIPNSVLAKRVLYSELGLFRTDPWELIERILELSFMLPWQAGALIASAGLFYLLARFDRFSSIPIWFAGNIVFLIIGNTHVHPWYLPPFHAVALLGAISVAVRAYALMPNWSKLSWKARGVRWSFAIFLVCLCSWGFLASHTLATHSQRKYEESHIAVARYLDKNALPNDVIYAPDIGYIGAITGRPILDPVGLVSPEVIPFNKRGDFAGVLRTMQPPWAVIGLYGEWQTSLLTDSWVRSNYMPVYRNKLDRKATWPSDTELKEIEYDWDYLILRKNVRKKQ
jgi:arabinofuranosyltransferase